MGWPLSDEESMMRDALTTLAAELAAAELMRSAPGSDHSPESSSLSQRRWQAHTAGHGAGEDLDRVEQQRWQARAELFTARFAELELPGLWFGPEHGGSGASPAVWALTLQTLAAGSLTSAWLLFSHSLAALAWQSSWPKGWSQGVPLLSGCQASTAGAMAMMLPTSPWIVTGGYAHTQVTAMPRTVANLKPAPLHHLWQGPWWQELEAVPPGKAGVQAADLSPAAQHLLAWWDALGTAALAVGLGQQAVRLAKTYALERKAFGKPISSFQAIQAQWVDANTQVSAAEAMVRACAVRSDLAARTGAELALAIKPEHLGDAAAARIMATTAAREATRMATQVYGGNGVMCEYPVEWLWRAAKVLELQSGGLRRATQDLLQHRELA